MFWFGIAVFSILEESWDVFQGVVCSGSGEAARGTLHGRWREIGGHIRVWAVCLLMEKFSIKDARANRLRV